MPGELPFSLPPNDPVLYLVQRLRDEAHRFAIGSHRAKRKKAMAENSLDDIAGIGPTRKRALLKHFGSAKSVSRAASGLAGCSRDQRRDGPAESTIISTTANNARRRRKLRQLVF